MPRPPGEVHSIKINDNDCLEYEVIGNGPPLVMLHGFLANRFTFSRQLESFAKHYRLILLNFRGCSGSSYAVPPDYGVGTSDLEDLSAVLEAENLASVNLFAHSSGGATAFALARNSPTRVDRVVLLEPTLIQLMPPAAYRKISAEYDAIIGIDEARGGAACLREAVTSAGGNAWVQLDQKKQEEVLLAMAGSAPFVSPHLRSLCELKVTEEDVRNFQAPLLLLYGDTSFWFQEIIADKFRENRPDLMLKTVQNAGHNVHRDQADTVNTETIDFLTK